MRGAWVEGAAGRSWSGDGHLEAGRVHRRVHRGSGQAFGDAFPGTTTSPSSLVKPPCCALGRMSSTASEGRQSLAPSGVTTTGRFIRMGWAGHLLDQLRVGPVGLAQAEFVVRRAFLAQQIAHGDAQLFHQRRELLGVERRLQILHHVAARRRCSGSWRARCARCRIWGCGRS